MVDFDEAAFEAYLEADTSITLDGPTDAFDPEAQADLELHDFLHPDGYR